MPARIDARRLVDRAVVHPDDDVAVGMGGVAHAIGVSPTTTSEQVASKPDACHAGRVDPGRATAARVAAQTASQTCALDCSAITPSGRCMAMSHFPVPSAAPVASNTPARADPVPTSMPIRYRSISAIPADIDRQQDDQAL